MLPAPDRSELSNSGGISDIPKDRRSFNSGDDLLKEFDPFSTQIVFEIHEARDITPGPSQGLTTPAPTGSETRTNTIGVVWVTRCRAVTLQRTTGQNNVWREFSQFRCEFTIPISIVLTPANIDPYISIVPSQLLQTLLKPRDGRLSFWITRGSVHEYSDPSHRLGLLGKRRQGPSGRCTGNCFDEIAPSHSLPRGA